MLIQSVVIYIAKNDWAYLAWFLLCVSLTWIKLFVPETVCHWQVLKSKSHVESPLVHCQLLYINDFPFSVLKLIFLAWILVPVTGLIIAQLSKNHSVSYDYVLVRSMFYSVHHPVHSYAGEALLIMALFVMSDGLNLKSATFLF